MKIYYSLDRDFYKNFEREDLPWCEEMIPKPMLNCVPDWFKNFKGNYDSYNHYNLKTCPSFVNSMKDGFVFKNQADLLIEVNNNTCMVYTSLPESVTYKNNIRTKVADYHFEHHGKDQFPDGFPFEKGFFPFSLKFISPYVFLPEENVDVMITPCWWDNFSFNLKSFHGMLAMPNDYALQFNINTMVRIPEEKLIIPKGTPICHIFFPNIDSIEFEYVQDLSTMEHGRNALKKTRLVECDRLSGKRTKKNKFFLVKRGK
tara:strand:- start:195 stop:971 length:777 start_codon:yes stop_codon:yes gene_type:complete